jgi:hypothetical protein
MPEPNSGCLLWLGSVYRGYGQTSLRGRRLIAHRAAWIVAHGDIPDGLFVCHKCDVPSCINPAHLFLGTHDDNMADRSAKGRAARMRGEKNASAKLTQEQADIIRDMPGTQEAVAARFGVNRSVVGKIKRGEIWRKSPVLTGAA